MNLIHICYNRPCYNRTSWRRVARIRLRLKEGKRKILRSVFPLENFKSSKNVDASKMKKKTTTTKVVKERSSRNVEMFSNKINYCNCSSRWKLQRVITLRKIYNGYLEVVMLKKKKERREKWAFSKCISLPLWKKNNLTWQAWTGPLNEINDNNKINLAAACIMFTRKPGRKRIMKAEGWGKNGTRDDNGKPNAAIQWTLASDSFIMPAADLISHPELSFFHRSEKS